MGFIPDKCSQKTKKLQACKISTIGSNQHAQLPSTNQTKISKIEISKEASNVLVFI
jgi:hypothetical protein